MEETKNELMEVEEEAVDTFDDVDYTEVNGGSGKVIGLVVAGLTVALGAVAYSKIKAKKDGKPKKKRKKLMWVDVDEDDVEDEDIEVDEDDVEDEDIEVDDV